MMLAIKARKCLVLLLVLSAMPQEAQADKAISQQVIDDALVIEECLNGIGPDPSNPPMMKYGNCEHLISDTCFQAAEYKGDPSWRRCVVRETEAFQYIVSQALEEAVQVTDNPNIGQRLMQSQDIWEDFRDTHCQTLADRYASGSFFASAFVICRLEMTSDRVVFLRGYSRDYYVERY